MQLKILGLFTVLLLLSCSDEDEGCPTGQEDCAGECVDLIKDTANCGACGEACAKGSKCSAGVCCEAGLSGCEGACLDFDIDDANCGACGKACGAVQICDSGKCRASDSETCTARCGLGRVCEEGACNCVETDTMCGNACVDVETNPEHCGSCDEACNTDQVCDAGACICEGVETNCNGACVDTLSHEEHCGTCNRACGQNDTCNGGHCAGPVGEDGCAGDARGIAISEVAVYQSFKITLTQGAEPIAREERIADVVAGRDTLFRVYVTVDADFEPREIAARLTLSNGEQSTRYFAKRVISGSSDEADSMTTLQISVPASDITSETRYAVSLVECDEPPQSGEVGGARVPAEGDVALQARLTGVLKIAIVPVQIDGMLADTSETALEVYRAYLLAMYPATDVQLSVIDGIEAEMPVDWVDVLDAVRAKRQQDNPPADLYYYGFLKPTATLEEFCRRGCTAGVGFTTSAVFASLRAAVGLAYGDEYAASVMAHEVGHSHGRLHAPCAPGGQIEEVDPDYPYEGAATGVWGYDNRERRLFDPEYTSDIMGYCSNQWISDYTYQALVDRIAAVNSNEYRIADEARIGTYWVMLLNGQRAPRWSVPITEPTEAFGDPELAEVLDAQGTVIEYTTVYRAQLADIDAATLLIPEPQSSWHAIRVQGAAPLAF